VVGDSVVAHVRVTQQPGTQGQKGPDTGAGDGALAGAAGSPPVTELREEIGLGPRQTAPSQKPDERCGERECHRARPKPDDAEQHAFQARHGRGDGSRSYDPFEPGGARERGCTQGCGGQRERGEPQDGVLGDPDHARQDSRARPRP
jgi:hypothetical protein